MQVPCSGALNTSVFVTLFKHVTYLETHLIFHCISFAILVALLQSIIPKSCIKKSDSYFSCVSAICHECVTVIFSIINVTLKITNFPITSATICVENYTIQSRHPAPINKHCYDSCTQKYRGAVIVKFNVKSL